MRLVPRLMRINCKAYPTTCVHLQADTSHSSKQNQRMSRLERHPAELRSKIYGFVCNTYTLTWGFEFYKFNQRW